MRLTLPIYLLGSASVAVAAAVNSAIAVDVRAAPGESVGETLHALRRHLYNAQVHRRDEVFGNSTEVEAAFKNTALLKIGKSIKPNMTDDGEAEVQEEPKAGGIEQSLEAQGSLEIACKSCFIKGTAHVSLSISGDVNPGLLFDDLAETFGDVVETITDNVTDYGKEVFASVKDGFRTGDFDFPPLDINLDIDLPDLPEAVLKFSFDQLELFVDMRAVLSGGATYKMALYDSSVPHPFLGFKIGEDLLVGVVFTVDLVVTASAEVTIESGFHLKLEDGFALELNMFAKEIAKLEMNGGTFEFLPVVVETDGILLDAVLRLSMRSGLTLKSPSFLADISDKIPTAGGGIEASVFANLAELTTEVTVPSLDDNSNKDEDYQDDEDKCHLRVTEKFQIEVGAAAGASVVLGDRSWGPQAATHTPLFYTTLVDLCAIAPAASTPALIEARQDDDLSTTTTVTEKVYTGLECMSTGLIACPASLESMHKFTVTETLTTAVPSGVDVVWDSVVDIAAFSDFTFGDGAKSLTATSGPVRSFVPPPEPISTVPKSSRTSGSELSDITEAVKKVGEDVEDVLEGSTGGVSNKVIIGVSVGLGVPVLVALIGGIFLLVRRRRNLTKEGISVAYSSVPGGASVQAVKTGASSEVNELRSSAYGDGGGR